MDPEHQLEVVQHPNHYAILPLYRNKESRRGVEVLTSAEVRCGLVVSDDQASGVLFLAGHRYDI